MMTNAWFLATIQQTKQQMKEDFLPTNYFIIIEEWMKTTKTYQKLPKDLSNAVWIIVVSPYNWTNLGYVNTSLKVVGMYRPDSFQKSNAIPFGDWELYDIGFICDFGQYYNAWQPYPKLRHRYKANELTAHNYKWTENFGIFNINNMNSFIDAIWAFEKEYENNK
ncbi:MAG: hypothetical protein LUH50_07075 [Bacteroides intestinalis]|nr:hypothetical protein [Bacteroides intestinalis]